MTLLIVIDMQNDFVTGALGTAEAQAIVPHVNAKIAAADAVVYTLDTHGEDYLATQEGKRLPVPHCIRGTWGHALADGLTVRAEAGRIEKPTFGSTALGELVRSRFAAAKSTAWSSSACARISASFRTPCCARPSARSFLFPWMRPAARA